MSNKTWRWIREEIRDFCDFSSHNFYRISLEKVNDVNEDFWEIYRCGILWNDVEFVWRSTVGYCSSAIENCTDVTVYAEIPAQCGGSLC